MNPTNESIGRAFREAEAGSFVHTTQVGLFRLILDRARELDRQAPGEWGGYEAFEQFLAAEIDSAPEALRRLGKWLGNVLDEDHFATANRLVLGAMLETSDAIRKVAASKAAPQPPAQEQGEALPVIADYTPVSPEEEAAVDAALGLVKVRMRVPADLHRELVAESESRGLVLAAVIRERLTRAAGAEDARDAARYRLLRDESMGGWIELPAGHGLISCDEPAAEWDACCDAAIASQAQEGEGNG